MTARTVLRGGLVADGAGETTQPADVLIEGAAIADVGAVTVSPESCEVIELAPGSVVCPGFIDAHAHAEGPLLETGRVDGALAQGVTTLVAGQDGQSWVGAHAATAAYLNRYFGPVNGSLTPIRDLSVAGYAAALAGRLAQNVAVLASQGTIRHHVAGLAAGPLTPGQLAAARHEVAAALADGAVGLSSGLDYLPSRFGAAAEVAEFARPLAQAGRPYVSHLRGYGADVRAGLDELVRVGRDAGVRVHASHLWGEPADIAAAFAAADRAGVPLSFDMYPYRKSSTILAALLLPEEVQVSGPDATIAALTDPRQRAALLSGEKFTGRYLNALSLGCLPDAWGSHAGLSITEAAARDGQPPGEWALDLLAGTELQVGAHLDRPTLTDGQLSWLVRHERHCAGSDGIYQGQHPHPRGYATFASLAAAYTRDDPATGWQRVARHLAANAADAFGLRDRGRLAPGMAADVCVIGPAGVTARASYGQPRELATGVHLVFVNGVITWRDGAPVAGHFPGALVS